MLASTRAALGVNADSGLVQDIVASIRVFRERFIGNAADALVTRHGS
jgi:hypothetical protein